MIIIRINIIRTMMEMIQIITPFVITVIQIVMMVITITVSLIAIIMTASTDQITVTNNQPRPEKNTAFFPLLVTPEAAGRALQ